MPASAIHPAVPLVGALVTGVFLFFSLRLRRRHRLLADLPTSKVRGVFIGLVELKGSAESEDPLTSYLAETRCVDYRWTVQEHWRRTRTESYTDSKGNRRTRTRTDTGWDTVASGGMAQSFYLRDDTGALLVHPAGARIDRAPLFDRTVSRGDPLYHGKGPDGSVRGSTGRRRFTEEGIRLHAPLYVVGPARERTDIVAPEIAADDRRRAEEFIISTRPEESVRRRLAIWSWVLWTFGLPAGPLALQIGAAQAAQNAGPETRPFPVVEWGVAAVCVYLLLWGLCWAWMAHNSLVGLRERVRQAWSLIEVQLKRRHDLLPVLNNTLAGLASHEKETQTALALLRAQSQATPPGVAGPDHAGIAAELRAVVERYPELRAREGFAALERELIDTEQRIALARSYYNDIATHYATRLEIVPDRWVASLRKLAPAPLLAAAHFERAPVTIRLVE